MIKQKRLLSLILLLTILLSGLTTGVYAEQRNIENGFKEWDEVHSVDAMKEWTIIFNQGVNPSTANDNNIYVTNHLGQKEGTRTIMGSDEKTVILQPPRGGYSSEYDYTLHIEDVLSEQDKKLSDNIAMKFFIEDDIVKDEVEYQDDVIKLKEVTASFDNKDYREIIMPLTEFTAKNLKEGSIIIIDPTREDIYGYAGKIVSYRIEGENVIIRTTEPLFEELFTHLDLKGKQEISVEQMLNAQLKEGIEAKPYQEYDLQTKRYTQGVEYIFGAKDRSIADVGIKYGDFIIKGSIKVENPDIDYDIKTSWGLFSGFKLDSFYLAYTADIVSNLEIEYKKSFSGNLDKKVTLFKYPVPLGATGLIVDLSLDVYADGDVKASGKIEAKLSQKAQITLGAKQAKNGNMEWVRNTTKEQPEFVSSIETEFKANAEAGISPTMELSFYKIASAGLVGKIGPYLKLDAKAKGKGDYIDGYFDGKLYAEAGVAFSSSMYLGAAFGLIQKDYSLGRAEIKIWSYTEEYNAETQGELQSIKFPEDTINMEVGDSKKLKVIGVYKNRFTGNIFEAPVDSGVEYILNPSDSASIDSKGNIKILTDRNREIEITVRYKSKEAEMAIIVASAAVDKADLYATITASNAKYDAAIEGDNVGQYAPGSKAVFKAAIEAAQAVADDNNATQTMVDRAIDDLATAKKTFAAAQVVTGGETSESYFEFDNTTGTITKYHPRGKTGRLPEVLDPIIPSQINGVAVTDIGDDAFKCNQLISVTMPDSLTSIGARAFYDNQLTNITIPDSVTSIGASAFAGTGPLSGNQLTSVIMPDSLISIGDSAFTDNQLTSVIIPNKVTSIGYAAFSGNQLTSVIIPDSVISIGRYAFGFNQLTNIVIPDSVTNIGEGAFCWNQLINVVISDSITNIEDSVFTGNQLTNVTVPNSITSIGDSAFSHNKLTSVTIPENVTSIGYEAFYSNKQLTEITIGEDVAFGPDAFSYYFSDHIYESSFYAAYNEGSKKAGAYVNQFGWVRQ